MIVFTYIVFTSWGRKLSFFFSIVFDKLHIIIWYITSFIVWKLLVVFAWDYKTLPTLGWDRDKSEINRTLFQWCFQHIVLKNLRRFGYYIHCSMFLTQDFNLFLCRLYCHLPLYLTVALFDSWILMMIVMFTWIV